MSSALFGILKVVLSKPVLVAIAATLALLYGYTRGYDAALRAQVATKVKAEQIADEKQNVLEVQHDARVRKILTHPLSDRDTSSLLSCWPDAQSCTAPSNP